MYTQLHNRAKDVKITIDEDGLGGGMCMSEAYQCHEGVKADLGENCL